MALRHSIKSLSIWYTLIEQCDDINMAEKSGLSWTFTMFYKTSEDTEGLYKN